jgi:TctA family transporter
VPYWILFPSIIVFASIGCYSIRGNIWEVLGVVVFGAGGFLLIRAGCEPVPLLLGFVLGPFLEENLRRALIISRGDPMIFITRPISATLLALAFIALVLALLPAVRKKREVVFAEEE